MIYESALCKSAAASRLHTHGRQTIFTGLVVPAHKYYHVFAGRSTARKREVNRESPAGENKKEAFAEKEESSHRNRGGIGGDKRSGICVNPLSTSSGVTFITESHRYREKGRKKEPAAHRVLSCRGGAAVSPISGDPHVASCRKSPSSRGNLSYRDRKSTPGGRSLGGVNVDRAWAREIPRVPARRSRNTAIQ